MTAKYEIIEVGTKSNTCLKVIFIKVRVRVRVRVSSIRQNRTMINTRWPRSEDVQHVLMSSES